jgi:hypothetical protein
MGSCASIGLTTAGQVSSAGEPIFFQRTSRQIQMALKLYFTSEVGPAVLSDKIAGPHVAAGTVVKNYVGQETRLARSPRVVTGTRNELVLGIRARHARRIRLGRLRWHH